ncbi:hypothetical protein AWC11_15985 [Mycobacterium interjectum]|nr:tetratricopeptide repeat protein [Mycobacterium terramassiliense]ORV86933.1 hypothetical protein AWC11_15985 [Mycobacterium interjectum]
MIMAVTTDTEDEKSETTIEDIGAEDSDVEDAEAQEEAVEETAEAEDNGAAKDYPLGGTDDSGEQKTLLGADEPRSWRRRPWGQYLRRSILPVLLVASLAISGFLGWKQWQEHQVELAGQQAQQAAVKYAEVLTSIDSNNVDQNFRQVLDGATGEFKDMYTQSSVQLRQLLIDNKATAHGVVVDSAIASESPNKVVVLVFVDQTVTNMAAPDPRIDRSRIKMTMEKVDGRWRASKVQLL